MKSIVFRSTLACLVAAVMAAPAIGDSYKFVTPLQGLFIQQAGETAPAGASQIDCSSSHCYAVVNGVLWSVGNGLDGQLGLNGSGGVTRSTWTQTPMTDVTKAVAGEGFGYVLKTDGTLWTVGDNTYGQLSRGPQTDRLLQWAQTLTDVTDVAAGFFSGYAVKDGEVYVVGRANWGELGLGASKTTDVLNWTPTGLTGVTKVAAGSNFGLAIKDGTVWSTGRNDRGQLGGNGITQQYTWSATPLSGVTHIDASQSASFAISGGTLWASGYNSYGQLGLGTTTDQIGFADTGFSPDSFSPGHTFNHAIKDGVLWSVGQNTGGALGLPGVSSLSVWTNTGLNGSLVASGSIFAYLQDSNESLMSTGWNDAGQLGHGDKIARNSFTPLTDPFAQP